MLKFGASIFGGELPIGLGVVGIAVVLPGGDFLDPLLAACPPSSPAVAGASWRRACARATNKSPPAF